MGKIRVKTFGDEEQEQGEQRKQKEKREQKILRQAQDKDVAQNAAEVSPEEKLSEAKSAPAGKPVVAKSREARSGSARKKERSKNYLAKASLLDRKNKYSISEALDLIAQMPVSGWDETVELHVNTVRTGQFGTVMLPHGTGKRVVVAIASDALIAEIEKGKIDFDILLAEPEMMPKLARVARFLGPKGLMPNPKNGTVSKNPQSAAKQFENGQLAIKTEGKFPILHLTIGKVSFGKEKLTDNIEAILEVVKTQNIKNATLKSTMSPGVKINAD